MGNITIFYVLIIIIHFLSDWVLQPRWVANGKKQSYYKTDYLLYHISLNVVVYLFVILGLTLLFPGELSVIDASYWFGINVGSHILIDRYLPVGKTERSMINWAALDQILHISILLISSDIFLIK